MENWPEQIDYPIVAKTHPPMYSMHKFWARKPDNVVSKYIEHYSREGDVVLDPFAGSGVTAIEALRLGRKTVAIDLNPMATFITRCTIVPVDIEQLEEAFRHIESNCRKMIDELYETKCTKCNGRALLLGTAWEDNTPFEKVYTCEKCGRIREKVSNYDLDKINEVAKKQITHWYPKNVKLPPMKKEKLDYVHELFSHRNLLSVSVLFHEICQLTDVNLRNIMKFVFTSALPQTTKMMPYVKESIGKICKGWTVHSYWVPPQHWELNVWEYFKLRYNETKRGKEQSNTVLGEHKEARDFGDLKGSNNGDYFLRTHSVLELSDEVVPQRSLIPSNSIDYVFTDPPYGGSIQYFELSVLWASWLGLSIDFDGEITINKFQKKNFERYDRMLKEAFRQVFRVLKPDRYLTVTFHSTRIEIRNSLIRAAVFAGFDMEKIVYQPPAVASAKARLQPYGSAIGDYYIRFRKPVHEKEKLQSDIDEKRYERVVVETVKRILAERGQPTEYSYLINFIDVELEKNGLLLGARTDIKDILEKYEGKEFTSVEVEEGATKGRKWWFKNPGSISFLERLPLNERVEKAVIDVLKSRDKVSFDEILQSIFIKFSNSLTPETQSIMQFLDSYATKTKDGRWRLNPQFAQLENQHILMIKYLVEIGKKLGYDVWAAHTDDEIGKVALKELQIPNILRIDRVREIDVLWIRGDRIEYEFEVENTTQITEAIVRGSNIPYGIGRIIVIPDRREGMLRGKFEEPLLAERIEKDGWKIIPYSDLQGFYEKASHRRPDMDAFSRMARKPRTQEKPVQETLTGFS